MVDCGGEFEKFGTKFADKIWGRDQSGNGEGVNGRVLPSDIAKPGTRASENNIEVVIVDGDFFSSSRCDCVNQAHNLPHLATPSVYKVDRQASEGLQSRRDECKQFSWREPVVFEGPF